MAGLFDTLDTSKIARFPSDGVHRYVFASYSLKKNAETGSAQLYVTFKLDEPGTAFHNKPFTKNFWIPSQEDHEEKPDAVEMSVNMLRDFFAQMGIDEPVDSPSFTEALDAQKGAFYDIYGKEVDDDFKGNIYQIYNARPAR